MIEPRYIRVVLYGPSTSADISELVSSEDALVVTSRIEEPVVTNRFVASDLSVSGRDSALLTATSILKTIRPESTNFRVTVEVDAPGTFVFSGTVIPGTVQFDETFRSFAFSAASDAIVLATTPADGVLVRDASGWAISSDVFERIQIPISKAGATLCDFEASDVIRLSVGGRTEDATVLSIIQRGSEWLLNVQPELKQVYAIGTPVALVTKHRRHVPFREAVDALFVAAGLPATVGGDYSVTPVGDGSQTFATQPSYQGLSGTPRSVVASIDGFDFSLNQTQPAVGTGEKLFAQHGPPTSDWTLVNSTSIPATEPNPTTGFEPVDWISQGTGRYILNGPRKRVIRTSRTTIEARYYCYDYSSAFFLPPVARYVLFVSWNSDTRDWSIDLRKQTTSDAFSWSAEVVVWAGSSGTTDTDMTPRFNDLSCEFVAIEGNVYFTDLYDRADGQMGHRISRYVVFSGVVNTNVVNNPLQDSRGILFVHTFATLGLYQLWRENGNLPRVRFFVVGIDFFEFSSLPLPWDFQPYSVKPNAGRSPNTFNALSSSFENGTYLLTFDGATTLPAVQIGPPGVGPSDPDALFYARRDDLCVVRDLTRPAGSGIPWPMMAIFGNRLYWVDFVATTVLAYADFDGLTCGDALAQLATLVAGSFHADPYRRTFFKTRAVNGLRSIGGGDVADDARCLTFLSSPVSKSAYLYVRIVYEHDERVFGAAGDARYAGSSLALELKTRFASSASFCTSVARKLLAFFGANLATSVVEHEIDGRLYDLDVTYLGTVGGTQRRFEIVEVEQNLIASTIKFSGVQLP